MFNIQPTTRVFLCSLPIDMRLSFDGLAGLVKSHFSMNAASGHWFVFFSRRRDRMKLLYCDSEGFWLAYRRLERGTFAWLDNLDLGEVGEINAADFAVVLAGVNPTRQTAPKAPSLRKSSVPPRVAPLQLV
jgi:hypothetical protein